MSKVIYPITYNGRWKNFPDDELRCSHTGLLNPNREFIVLMDHIQVLRDTLGFSLPISSGYRHETHPIEAKKIAKGKPAGEHTRAAVDIAVSREQAYIVLRKALEMGFSGIGINQKGKGRFIHLDIRKNPTLWSY